LASTLTSAASKSGARPERATNAIRPDTLTGMQQLLWVCAAGALGSGTRYAIGNWAAQRFGLAFPYGTLIVNLVGCFLIALVMHIAAHSAAFSPHLRVVVTTGFLGGLTTYSSFNYETTRLAQQGAAGLALVNFAVTTFGCLAAGLLGLALAQRMID
jgi:fluoride exporter